MADKDAKEVSQVPPPGFERVEDFYVDYANNVYLESSAWDLKMIFGQLDQGVTPVTTEQRAAITIPWAQAVILNYLLSVHIRAHELDGGKIQIPQGVIPPEPPTEGPPEIAALYAYMRKLHKETFYPDTQP